MSKLFTALLNHRLSSFLEVNNLLGEEQAGFRSGYATTDHSLALHFIIEHLLTKRGRLYCAFVDYQKAFDTVDRKHLWSKLVTTGVTGKILTVIQNLYYQAKSCVRHNKELSEIFPCNIGVRQGENLSPLLFSIYLNDLNSLLSDRCNGTKVGGHEAGLDEYLNLFTLLYADDTILLSESEKDLQTALDNLSTYCTQWKLTVNTSKTKEVIFSRGKVRNIPKWQFGPDEIETRYEYTYLGTSFNYNGTFNRAMAKQVTQAKRALYGLIPKFRKLNLPIDIQCHLIDSCIVPILLYGSEVWGFANIKQIEVFHNQTCKQILGLHKRSSNIMAQGELGRFNMMHYVTQRVLNFWAHTVNGKQCKISSLLYRMLKVAHDQGTHTSKWMTFVQDNLNKAGLGYLWNQEQFNTNWFKHRISQVSSDTNKQDWRSAVDQSGQCQTYKQIKTNLEIEPYLTLLTKKKALSLRKFRTGNHYLPITFGRYTGVNREDRLCNLCIAEKIGDEYHYLFECTFFSAKRPKYVNETVLQAQPHLKMKKLFSTTNADTLNNLAVFVCHIMEECKAQSRYLVLSLSTHCHMSHSKLLATHVSSLLAVCFPFISYPLLAPQRAT